MIILLVIVLVILVVYHSNKRERERTGHSVVGHVTMTMTITIQCTVISHYLFDLKQKRTTITVKGITKITDRYLINLSILYNKYDLI